MRTTAVYALQWQGHSSKFSGVLT